MAYLLDTGFAVAMLNRRDSRHDDVVAVMKRIQPPILFPVPAITETVYLLMRDARIEIAASFVSMLAVTDLVLIAPQSDDYQRAAELMRQYADARLDFVDAIIVAIAERLNITQLLTLDQRDFRLIRPIHCTSFELLP